MSRRKRPAPNSEALIRKKIFGPPPILKNEDPAEYELSLARLYVDVKPTDITVESLVGGHAYWNWEVRRWRRMKICVIEAARPAAMSWVLGGPRSQRLKLIGELNDLGDVDVKKSASDSDNKPPPPLISEEESARRVDELKDDFRLIDDTITTRVFLEEFDLLERIDRMIAIAESRRNAAYREIHCHRAALNYAKKIRTTDEAEFKIIRSAKRRAKRKQQKMRHD